MQYDKNITILMKCLGEEIYNYFNNIPEISNNYIYNNYIYIIFYK